MEVLEEQFMEIINSYTHFDMNIRSTFLSLHIFMSAQHFPFQDPVIVFFHGFLLTCFRQKVSLCAHELLVASGAG